MQEFLRATETNSAKAKIPNIGILTALHPTGPVPYIVTHMHFLGVCGGVASGSALRYRETGRRPEEATVNSGMLTSRVFLFFR